MKNIWLEIEILLKNILADNQELMRKKYDRLRIKIKFIVYELFEDVWKLKRKNGKTYWLVRIRNS